MLIAPIFALANEGLPISGRLRGVAFATASAFTLFLLIASRAFDGRLLDQAKVGILLTALLAPMLAALALRAGRSRRTSSPEFHNCGHPTAAPASAS